MSLQLLNPSARLITDVDPVIINLCKQLGIDTYWIILEHDHIYIVHANNLKCLFLTTAPKRTPQDVYVTPDVFLNIILDIASGMATKLAYEKQGYTYAPFTNRTSRNY